MFIATDPLNVSTREIIKVPRAVTVATPLTCEICFTLADGDHWRSFVGAIPSEAQVGSLVVHA